jgi:hypothetical protein
MPPSGSGTRATPRDGASQDALRVVVADAPRAGGARRLELVAGPASEAEGDGGLEAGSPELPTAGRYIQYSTLSYAMLR